MVVGSQQTVISGTRATLTFGTGIQATTTTSGTSSSGQKVLTTAATTGFVVGQTVVIDPGSATQETAIIASIQAGTSLTMLTNLVSSHLTSLTVNQYYNLYAVARTFNFESGNKQTEYPVVGTDIPIIVTEEFSGNGKMTILLSSETANSAQFLSLLQPSGGQVPPVNLIVTGYDTSATVALRAFTWLGTIWPEMSTLEESGPTAVVYSMSFKMSGRAIQT